MIVNDLISRQTYLSRLSAVIFEKKMKEVMLGTVKKHKIFHTKIKVIGNFFKLTYAKKKNLTKFNLCLAHRMYLYNNRYPNTLSKKTRKNTVVFAIKTTSAYKIKGMLNSIYSLKKKRALNQYTKKGIKTSNAIYNAKTGKKTTYT